MAKQQVCQKYIFKLHSTRLRKARWNLTLPLHEARKNDEIVSLADSQVLRWIDELNGVTDADRRAKEIKEEIGRLRKEGVSTKAKRAIRDLYEKLDEIQFKPDYMCLIIDKNKDYKTACGGFKINGVRYKRLLGTNGGIKNSTIVFVSERLLGELNRRIENDRDMSKPLVPAKLEAYKALTCSASTPVSMPEGILIVQDFETVFHADTIYLDDAKDGEPVMELRKNSEVTLDGCDGCGIMLPSLAEKWSAELGLEYMVSGLNTRFSWEKGMVFTFDFIDFANKVSRSYIVKDAWGDEVDIRDVELVLTTSMVKLWDMYESCEQYLMCCEKNKYTFGIAKTCPEYLENERSLNYQFIQSYDLDDDDIEELIRPTIDELHEVIHGDWRKTLLFLCGGQLNDNAVLHMNNGFIKAIMADSRMANDPFVAASVYQLIKNRINEAKVGVLKVHGNYSIVSGDPYALCQSIFGMKVTGLLGAGEIYNKYWVDAGAECLACYRAPMTCHNNIRMVHPKRSDETAYWYQYMKTCTIMNAWDTSAQAMNGMDFDGDLVMLTDNHVLVDKMKPMPTLMCAQRKANKIVPSEDDLVRSNIESFGNDIGRTTNWITSMFEVQSRFPKDSREFKVLDYRIRCGQLYQQNAIDKAKGIVCKPMPREWHDRHAAMKIEDYDERMFYRSIVADKKPYFMRYIYPALMKQYNTYIRNTERNAYREFGMPIDEMKAMPYDKLTDKQREFLRYYDMMMPVGMGKCVMNKICMRFEEEFDTCTRRMKDAESFDNSIMKKGVNYTRYQYDSIVRICNVYQNKVRGYRVFAQCDRVDSDELTATIQYMKEALTKECLSSCNNGAMLCDIMVDALYNRSSTKRLVWDVCASEIINNLLENNDHTFSYPAADDDGDITYCGNRYTIKQVKVGEAE